MTSPLSILEWPPPSAMSLSAIIPAALAHLSAAEPLHRVMQKVGLDEDTLQTVHLTMPPPPPSVVSIRACPPRHVGRATIMGTILVTVALAGPILALLAATREAIESRIGNSSLWLAV